MTKKVHFHHGCWAFPIAILLISLPYAALADSAVTLGKLAEEDVVARRYEDAVGKYLKAFETSQNPAYLFNVSALYLMRLNDPLNAWRSAMTFAEMVKGARDKQDGEALAKKAEARLVRTHGKVILKVSPKGASAWLGEKRRDTAFINGQIWAEPGRHRILVEATGHYENADSVLLKAGGTETVELRLEPQPAVLVVECPVKECQIQVDGGLAQKSPLKLEVKPGRHMIRAEAPGLSAFSDEVVIGPGENRTVKAGLSAKAEKIPDIVKSAATVNVAPARPAMRIGAYVSFGVGAAAILTGAVMEGLGWATLADVPQQKDFPSYTDYETAYNDWRGKANGTARTEVYTGYGLIGAGVLGLAIGTVLYIESKPAKRLALTVTPGGPGGLGLTAVASW